MITYYFHVSKSSRLKFQIDANLFALMGNVVISDFKTAREISDKINIVRRSEGKFDQQVTAGQINALGLLHEIFHLLIRKYEDATNKNVFKDGIDFLKKNLTEDELDKTLLKFVEDFPPLSVFQNKITALNYLNGNTKEKSNREIILEELIILQLENINPATYQLKELYSDEELIKQTKYKEIIEQTELYFEGRPKIGGINLISFLRKPIIESPYNIEEQLDFIRLTWNLFLDESVFNKLLSGKDLIREDSKLFVQHGGGEKGTPPVPSYEVDKKYYESLKEKLTEGKKLSPEEYEYHQLEVKRFTEDIDWMPRVVLIAKNAFVWLHQLTKKYGREIKTLDQIPDSELDDLAKWNFTALWLIGIWERSSASRKIKQMMGNPEAASSAYSLYDYVIAFELGGETSFEKLKARAWQRGIRLSSDMVPNHTGIYSKWVVEKPEYFIQSKVPPYPNYNFKGVNLSDDERVEVRIEDQYYSRKDAAVVFERIDKFTGNKTYIYHGNDGTNMPWNDTAQLDLMKAEVRESLIQTIMHVARKTPIIRFDAAMTLAKKHFQRLWFPIPGSGGAIPSRSDYAMTRSQFDSLMPEEFWREVVDRINSEMPNTLLLAEAFWLMEGYFVRTLGMHRVYNSAFMHMFMKEENDKYRLLIKNTLAFNPEILKRYVNFMSNPDEETAINQFGKGDKYFGVATMLVTLPGLPMFAHGQIEGFSEKYGMEYKRSYYNEFIDDNLVVRHQKEIFPLVKKRYLFSQVDNFQFYDFIDNHGTCNENVFAFTNKSGDETALVIYNNSLKETNGTLSYSNEKTFGEEGRTTITSIDKALNINSNFGFYYIFRDSITQLEFIVSGSEISPAGFYFHLSGYQSKVLLDFKEVYDTDGRFKLLHDQLGGRGVGSIIQALNEMNLSPFHNSIVNLFTSIKFSKLMRALDYNPKDQIEIPHIDDEVARIYNCLNRIIKLNLPVNEFLESISNEISSIKEFNNRSSEISLLKLSAKWISEANSVLYPEENLHRRKYLSFLLLNKILFKVLKAIEFNTNANMIFDELLLWKPLFEIFTFMNMDPGLYFELSKTLFVSEYPVKEIGKKSNSINKINSKSKIKNAIDNKNYLEKYFTNIFNSEIIAKYLQVNEYQNTKYFNKERIELLIRWNFILSNFNNFFVDSGKKTISKKIFTDKLKSSFNIYLEVLDSINLSEFKVNRLILSPEINITIEVQKKKKTKSLSIKKSKADKAEKILTSAKSVDSKKSLKTKRAKRK